MNDDERNKALEEEAEALDRQIVEYVVAKLSAEKLSGNITLSDEVQQKIESTFLMAAKSESAAFGEAIKGHSQELLAALEQHRAALANASGKEAGTVDTSQMRAGEPNKARSRDHADMRDTDDFQGPSKRSIGRYGIMIIVGTGLLAASIIGGLSYLLYTNDSAAAPCTHIAKTNSEIHGLLIEVERVTQTETFIKENAKIRAKAQDNSQADLDLFQQANLKLGEVAQKLSDLRKMRAEGCGEVIPAPTS